MLECPFIVAGKSTVHRTSVESGNMCSGSSPSCPDHNILTSFIAAAGLNETEYQGDEQQLHHLWETVVAIRNYR